jgi:hypothetical protein
LFKQPWLIRLFQQLSVSPIHLPKRKILRNIGVAVLNNVRDCLCISLYSGGSKDLRDRWFREKVENFWKIGRFGELVQSKILSIYIYATVGKACNTASL